MIVHAWLAATSQTAAVQNGIVRQWSGRIAAPLSSSAPPGGVITDAAELARLWRDWKIAGDVPSVDFTKYLVLVATARSSVFQVRAVKLDAAGDLTTVGVATPDVTADVAFVVTLTPRDGVKTIQGRPIE